MCDIITQAESKKILVNFGKSFHAKILGDLRFCADKWKLTKINLVDYFSVNCVFLCHSQMFGDAVLKIGRYSNEEFTSEINALREYDGRKFCRIFDSDVENAIILEERISPGTQLREVQSLNQRLDLFTSLFNGLHRIPKNPGLYPTYIQWVCRITDYMSGRDEYKELYHRMRRAKDICLSISGIYNKNMLLHGDFHHDNILKNSRGGYTIIDPKGVIGDPVFDVPRFILNECFVQADEVLFDKINMVIGHIGKSLGYPEEILRQCFYVEAAMAACWDVEDGEDPNLNDLVIAEGIMEGKLPDA